MFSDCRFLISLNLNNLYTQTSQEKKSFLNYFNNILTYCSDFEFGGQVVIISFIFLSVNPECVFIVEKFIETITINDNKIRIKNSIFMHCMQLCNNPYGNYLIQFILKHWKNDDIRNIQNVIIENANYLVQQRYSSNVIEKCIEIFSNEKRKRLVRNMCLKGDILELIKNQYGHYVINKAIIFIENDVKAEIENILNSKMPEMNKKEKSKSKKFILLLKDNNYFKKKLKNKKNNITLVLIKYRNIFIERGDFFGQNISV